jgi:hypothetical protein
VRQLIENQLDEVDGFKEKDGLLRPPVLRDGMELLRKTCTHEVFLWRSEIAIDYR